MSSVGLLHFVFQNEKKKNFTRASRVCDTFVYQSEKKNIFLSVSQVCDKFIFSNKYFAGAGEGGIFAGL